MHAQTLPNAPSGDAQLRIAYLVNQYPSISHSFIRREIHALERVGVDVRRVAVRGWNNPLVDPQDRLERERTQFLLQRGFAVLLGSLLSTMMTSPHRFLVTLRLALGSARVSEKSIFYHLAYLVEACLLLQWLKGWRVQHLHAHFGTNSAQVAMLARSLGGPTYSFTVHGSNELNSAKALYLSEKISRAAFVVAVSSFGRSQIFRWIDYTQWQKVHVIRCGVDADFYADAPDRRPTSTRLICIGRLCEQKGQILLVEAAALLKRRGVSFVLVLAGDGEMRPMIESAIDRHGLRDQVLMTGWISSTRVREELLTARALVLPSFAEGLPVVIMEAMSLRCPVISTFVAGIPELVQPGQSGWLIPAGDVHALADVMQSCLQSPDEALHNMGELARAQVLSRHDVDVEAGKLAALFHRIISATANQKG